MADKWFPLSIEQTDIPGGFQIVLTTDVPCHLYLYWSDKRPWVHRASTTERGLAIPWAAYWCYVAWTLLDQEEAGDTYVHTYIWTGWQVCQTKYFHFHGTIGGNTSPSDSPILHKHFVYVPPTYLAYSHCGITEEDFVNRSNYKGIGFRALKSGSINKLRIYGNRYLNLTNMRVRLYHTDIFNGIPIEPPFVDFLDNQSTWPLPGSPDYFDIPFPSGSVIEGNYYCLCISLSPGGSGQGMHWYKAPACPDTPTVWHLSYPTSIGRWIPLIDKQFWFELD